MKNCGGYTLDGMAPINETDYHSDIASSGPPMEETTTTKRHRLNSSTRALTSPSGDSLPTLPFDLVVEILSRVPVKSLMQLQFVCKSWKSLISDSKFAKKNLRMSITRCHLVTQINPSRGSFVATYPLPSFFSEVTVSGTLVEYPLSLCTNRFYGIVASCHGMLCFAFDQRFALLWNPSIRKFAKLPSLENPKREESDTIYSLGYDHINHTYKVVAVNCFKSLSSYDNRVCKFEVKVYTLGTNYWKNIQDFPSGVPYGGSGKFVSGTINWLAVNDSYTSLTIVSLGLEKETYEVLLQPDYGAVNVVTKTLGVLRDCLCILADSDTFSDVWLMKEYGNIDSWAKVFRVPHMGDVGSRASTKALYVTEDDQVLLQYQAKLVVYNSRDGTFKTHETQNLNGWLPPVVYQESLISPCS